MYEVERFIEEAYQIAGRAYATYFQVQFITVNIDSIDLLVVQNAEINYIRGTKSQKTKQKQREHNKQLKGNKNGKKKNDKNAFKLHWLSEVWRSKTGSDS